MYEAAEIGQGRHQHYDGAYHTRHCDTGLHTAQGRGQRCRRGIEYHAEDIAEHQCNHRHGQLSHLAKHGKTESSRYGEDHTSHRDQQRSRDRQALLGEQILYRMSKHVGGDRDPTKQADGHQNVDGNGALIAKRKFDYAIGW